MLEKLGGRKFVFGIALMLILAGMFIAKVGLEEIKTFFNYAVIIFATYVGGNVAQKFSPEIKG